MSNLLQALLNRESAERALALAVEEDELAEYRRLVQGIHDAYAPYGAQVQKLQLRGDYGRPVVLGERDKHLTSVAMPQGLHLHLGARISPEALRLYVRQRKGATPASIELSIERHHPYKSETLMTFDAKTAPEHLLQAFFEVLVKYLHQASFADAKATEA